MPAMTTRKAPRRLSEQDLAQLYLQTEAPLRLDALLQDNGEEVLSGDAAQIAVHDSISGQTPDLALISLSLCGLIVVRDYPLALKDGPLGPVLRELVVACEDNLVTVGRLWLDSACYGIAPDPEEDRETILSIPDRLRILASIFMELRDAIEDIRRDEGASMYRAIKTLYYQAESHADLADRFVGHMTAPMKKPAKPKPAAEAAAKTRKTPDQIPLPFDLSRPRAGAEIVHFSLFRDKR